VGVGGGGDGPPRGPDLLIREAGVGGQAQHRERGGGHVRASCAGPNPASGPVGPGTAAGAGCGCGGGGGGGGDEGGVGGWGGGGGGGRAIGPEVHPPACRSPACPTSRVRAMSGSAVQACWMREEPSSPHMPPMTLVAVSITRLVPASSQTGWG